MFRKLGETLDQMAHRMIFELHAWFTCHFFCLYFHELPQGSAVLILPSSTHSPPVSEGFPSQAPPWLLPPLLFTSPLSYLMFETHFLCHVEKPWTTSEVNGHGLCVQHGASCMLATSLCFSFFPSLPVSSCSTVLWICSSIFDLRNSSHDTNRWANPIMISLNTVMWIS